RICFIATSNAKIGFNSNDGRQKIMAFQQWLGLTREEVRDKIFIRLLMFATDKFKIGLRRRRMFLIEYTHAWNMLDFQFMHAQLLSHEDFFSKQKPWVVGTRSLLEEIF